MKKVRALILEDGISALFLNEKVILKLAERGNNQMAKIIVIGGGISGLCTAISLQQIGHDVTLYEGAPTYQSPGAGLIVGGNALKVIAKLGIK